MHVFAGGLWIFGGLILPFFCFFRALGISWAQTPLFLLLKSLVFAAYSSMVDSRAWGFSSLGFCFDLFGVSSLDGLVCVCWGLENGLFLLHDIAPESSVFRQWLVWD